MKLNFTKTFTSSLIAILLLAATLTPQTTWGQASGGSLLDIITGGDDSGRGTTETEETVEDIFAARRGGYIKSADNDVAECDINFQRFGPLVANGVTFQESGKPTRYDGTQDPTATQQPPNIAEPMSIPSHEVGSMLYLNREICLQLKAIRRVQYDMEEKLFVEDPTSRKYAATSIDKAESQFRSIMETGRAISPLLTGTANALFNTNSDSEIALASAGLTTQEANDAFADTEVSATAEHKSNIVANYADERNNVTAEVISIFKDYLRNSDNIHGAEVTDIIEETLGKGIGSTMTKAEYDRYESGCTDCSDQEFWDLFLGAAQPENNKNAVLAMALGEINKRTDNAVKDLVTEIQAGDGYLGTRKCVGGFNPEGACLKWEISSPGSALADMSHRFAYSAMTQAEQADNSEEEFVSKEFNFSNMKIFDLDNYDALRENLGVFDRLDSCLDTVSENLDESREVRPTNEAVPPTNGLIGSIASDPLSFFNEATLILGNIEDFYDDCISSFI